MTIFRMNSFCFLAFFLLISRRCLTLISSQSLQTNQAALFIFGDSFFDAGNNNYINTFQSARANYWPYGQTTFKHPTGRFSDGRIIPDFIAEYAWLPLIPPYLQPGNHQFTYGVNFASGGAGALSETNQGLVLDLKTQLGHFKEVEQLLRQKLRDAEAKKLFSRAIYIFSIGANDYLDFLTTNSSMFQAYTKKEYVDIVVGNTTDVIKEIYEIGGRKFGIPNLEALGCAPALRRLESGREGSCTEEATELARLHNEALSKVLKELERQLKGFKYAIHDTYTSFSERMNNPSKYGFKEVKMACCGSGPYRGTFSCGGKLGAAIEYQLCQNASGYLFFDSFHVSEKLNQQLAELMWNAGSNVTGPYNLKALFEYRDM